MDPMRLDGVELKVNIDENVDAACGVLGLADGEAMRIWFYEDLTPGVELALLAAGVVVRVRSRKGGDDGDCTVKLRPCRRSQLTDSWLATTTDGDLELRVELDRTATSTVLAASLERDLDRRVLAEVEREKSLPADAVADQQLAYLGDCAPARVNLATLARLGPVSATRWKSVVPLATLGVRAERWTVGDLDFLELSVKVDPDEADPVAGALATALSGLALKVATGETKTRRVLEHLAGHREGLT